MHEHGYRIVPINPKLETALGVAAKPTLGAIDEPIDLVDVFRAPSFVPAHADEVLAMRPRPKVFWMQLGVRSPEAAERLARAGVKVVQDRCLKVEHQRLLGP